MAGADPAQDPRGPEARRRRPKATPDLSEFEALSKPSRAGCPLRPIIERTSKPKLSAKEIEKLLAACAQPHEAITHLAISQWLKARGLQVAWQSVGSHRRGVCSCG